MEFPYDIQKDLLYLEGKAEGKAEGKKEVIIKMLQSADLTPAQIAEFTDVPEKYVMEIKRKLKKKG